MNHSISLIGVIFLASTLHASPFTVDTSTLYISGGQVGIKTTTPGTVLDVNGTVTIRAQATVTSTLTVQGNAFSVNTSALNVNSNQVGIGTTTPAVTLHVTASGGKLRVDRTSNNAVGATVQLYKNRNGNGSAGSNSDDGGYVEFHAFNSAGTDITMTNIQGTLATATAGSEKGTMFFNTYSDGNNDTRFIIKGSSVGIRSFDPSQALEIGNGDAQKPTGISWLNPSDRKLKKDIVSYTDGMNVLARINPVRYRLNGKAGLPENTEGIGVIAEDVQSVAPYMIKPWFYTPEDRKTHVRGPSEEYMAFDGSALTFALINAVKEQQQQIDKLSVKVRALESQVNSKR